MSWKASDYRMWSLGKVKSPRGVLIRANRALSISTTGEDLDIRWPEHRWSIAKSPKHDVQHTYHVDGPRHAPFPWVITWSNTVGTELRTPDERVVQGEPNEIILFDNAWFTHRAPQVPMRSRISKDRIFARIIYRGPSELEVRDVPNVWRFEI